MQLSIPVSLADAASRDPDGRRREWVRTLPRVVAELAEGWSLRLGEPFQPGGQTAWVAPARGVDGLDLVLKVGWRHSDAAHEADGLRLWDGEGAVRLHAARELGDTTALLLERARPGTALSVTEPEEQQDIVVAGLLHRLWREPPTGHDFRRLQVMCDEWAAEFEEKAASSPDGLDPGLAREGVDLFRTLPASADRQVLLCTDLHGENILAARREPWLAIDPKPFVGDPAYDVLQHMLNCPDRLGADPRGLARRMAELLDLDRDRVTQWLFARCVQESPDWPGLRQVARALAPG